MQGSVGAGGPIGRVEGRLRRLSVLWWLLTLLGCLALVRAPWLPWAVNWDGASTVGINGFNGLADDSALQFGASDTSQTGSQDDGTVPDLPSLSSIPPDSGGTDANARGGVFVLVLGATALFVALWTLRGEAERRRSMARIVFVLGALALIPLLRDLFRITHAASALGTNSVGMGIVVGLVGSAGAMIGSGLLYWSTVRSDA